MKALDVNQVQRLFEVTEDHRLHALWVLLATTGLRISEVLGLQWDAIDRTTGAVIIRQAMQPQKGKGMVMVDTKTDFPTPRIVEQ
jgi:integrase